MNSPGTFVRRRAVRPRWLAAAVLAAAGVILAAWPGAASAQEAELPVLARVEVAGPLAGFPLPVHAHLQDKSGQEYLLVYATPLQLTRVGWPARVLDSRPPGDFLLAAERRPGAKAAAQGRFTVVHDDGLNWLVLSPGQEAESLAELGFALARLPRDPIVWPRLGGQAPLPAETLLSGVPDPLVAEMVGRVSTNHLLGLVRRLTGAEPAVSGGDLYPILTRHSYYSYSGKSMQKATTFCYEHLQALGLTTSFHAWGSGSNNVLGVQMGGSKSNEIVVVVAHLDDMPTNSLAPGADDNASGSAAVLMAAEMFRQYQFERTVRFLLVTGEEQGLLGSAAYATTAYNAGDNIVAVFNMDMISWDSNGDGKLGIHTHFPTHPAYSNDLVIAQTFTNAAALYGLTPALQPVINANGENRSDHASFWNKGYAAVLAIEDFGDFHAYYHTTNDTIARINWPYFIRFVQASLATVAHLAGPTGRAPLDLVQVASSDSTPTNGIGAALFHAKHEPGASESGADPLDTAWTNLPPNPNARWLKIHSEPYSAALATDSRPADSETLFFGKLSAVETNGVPFSCTNRLRFDFLSPPPSNRLFLARVHVDGAYTAASNDFNCVTNIRALADAGGYLNLPPLTGLSNGVAYGTCEIASRFLDMEPTNCTISIVSAGGTQAVLGAFAQTGARIGDTVEVSTNLVEGNGWTTLAVFTNDVLPDSASFDAGWTTLPRVLDTSSLTNAPGFFFRLTRAWLQP